MIVLTTIVYMAEEKEKLKNFVLLFSIWILSFFLISRTVFILLGLMVFFYILLHSFHSKNGGSKIVLYTSLLLLLCIMYYVFDPVNVESLNFSNNRIYSLIVNGLSGDNSLNERQLMFLAGINDILSNPFFGHFGGQLLIDTDYWHEPRWGAFIHNIFSYYRQFGLIPFLAINILVIIGLIFAYNKNNLGSIFWGFVFFSIEIYIFRSFTSPYIYLFIGYVSNKGIRFNG
ncbi:MULTISPECIES: hypothetical protein [unclassified Vibrio]|uniref:hypothetical protein n=1 Tax=unclassified Vibrio TaxID=2614977 RepID=UPI002964B270|nr:MULTISPECIES: hypothetical protein [unclassified Vibrio]MDW1579753.1 hypothetical protein [Vibrio sp. Vb2897]MDW1585908.1 hypothetical protein [Vibrio sp. Vb2910]MDW1594795.1 hypothetical protein [Vibrio sp. Vb2911]MDW1638014.1 hypothetical protein [Vibrio sp. Vb2896]MDW1648317.1 hypothetical protein [Vibrio sp. Vb2912]